jgi:lipopolysaccharide/colanic/teichoic acid biosynthesis glycosyltransferase
MPRRAAMMPTAPHFGKEQLMLLNSHPLPRIGSMLTRITDICFSLFGLVALGLCYPLAALLIKLDSRGPVFFKCNRVGLNGKIFRMYKFRTMYDMPFDLGYSVCPLGDPRVTPVGRLLRRSKVNELPQAINLFKGEMTLIGPRPESPDLAAAYPPEARRIFSIKPGLIGPNQILGRNEEECYPPGIDPRKYYLETLLPRRLQTDLQYLEGKSILKNFKLFFLTLWVILAGASSRRLLLDNRAQILLLLGDAFFCLVSILLAHLLRFESLQVPFLVFYKLLPLAVLVRLPFFFFFDFYQTLIRYLSLVDIKRIMTGVAFSSLAFVSIAFFLGLLAGYSRGVFLIDWLCLSFLLTGYRGLAWKYQESQRRKALVQDAKINVLIWGAGDCGELCSRFLRNEQQPSFKVIGFIDDDPAKRGKRLNGVKVLGDRHQLRIITQLYKIQQVFIAIAEAPLPELKQILRECRNLEIRPQMFLTKTKAKEAKHSLQPLEESIPANGYFSLGVVADSKS